MAKYTLFLGEPLGKDEIRKLCKPITVKIPENAKKRLDRSVAILNELNRTDQPVYGVSTGFGHLQNTWIDHHAQQQLQINLIRSHAAGTGAKISDHLTKIAMILLANSLAKGYSGIRNPTLELLVFLINHNLIPVTYTLGSLGASGDLAPLAHVALVVIGEGEISQRGRIRPTPVVFEEYDIRPVTLEAKEGLALINGTHFMTAYAIHVLNESKSLLLHSLLGSALSLESLMGTDTPFSEHIASVRPYHGHKIISEIMRGLLEGSEILASHEDPRMDQKVQDPYVLRCIPQVMGAIWDAFVYLENTLSIEINAVTDNPLIFAQEESILSGGNFHGEPLALPLETIILALVELGNITEGRISRLVNPTPTHLGKIQPFLADNPGVESGYMIAHYTVAAILNRLRTLAHPSVTDNIPVSGGQEDHVSMGMNSATRAFEVLTLVEEIVAAEILMARRALNLSKQHQSSQVLEKVLRFVNERLPPIQGDHVVRNPIQKMSSLLREKELIEIAELEHVVTRIFGEKK